MDEASSDERIAELLRRLYRLQEVVARDHFDALTRVLMQAIGAAAMAEAERRSVSLSGPPPPRPGPATVIPFSRRPPASSPGSDAS